MRDDLNADECSRRLKALADSDRLRIVQCLQQGELSVGDVALALDAEIANVSHHLGVLRNAALVQDRREGKYVYYSLHPDVFRSSGRAKRPAVLDLGCCKLELTP
ncbi:MAG: metalloregulator ArsR/SmtB family transcription factor [Pirellulales bacterium]